MDFINKNPFIGFYFKDVVVRPEVRRGKFIMNDTISQLFPEDDEFGTSWLSSIVIWQQHIEEMFREVGIHY